MVDFIEYTLDTCERCKKFDWTIDKICLFCMANTLDPTLAESLR